MPPVLVASPYKDTAVPTAVPVVVFVITEVRVDAPADKVLPTVNEGIYSLPCPVGKRKYLKSPSSMVSASVICLNTVGSKVGKFAVGGV